MDPKTPKDQPEKSRADKLREAPEGKPLELTGKLREDAELRALMAMTRRTTVRRNVPVVMVSTHFEDVEALPQEFGKLFVEGQADVDGEMASFAAFTHHGMVSLRVSYRGVERLECFRLGDMLGDLTDVILAEIRGEETPVVVAEHPGIERAGTCSILGHRAEICMAEPGKWHGMFLDTNEGLTYEGQTEADVAQAMHDVAASWAEPGSLGD